ncbi:MULTISPECIES: universal stress protein UspB [Vibrio]|uniref:Universal stress protein B homolog n=1 Tax=Vibrio proteolyticus NBRC 13287 TaxID=1219065 RepID=U2ZNK9_VIBPR|nr:MULTISPECIES: universal stress protein UspB [Vibrio]NAW56693.1 universal stress protein UspB [Vibrio sp. V36_P2S2PM302]NAX20755.1 universal stress protein UspB [Vibrio sp. V39_P1S14PM300]NAX25641.1 universal stress protein UspB [Vibrio sp. V38_P2S17PM301]NAX30392.1 universal stress protein UspB [Vibrio sp. V37_P2S8PM304]GAD69326.1 universal stress protein B homolog [Vibrio proteolyticus NBRC 13287]
MISGDTILFALMLVTLVNMARYFTALRSLLHIMREAHPLLYQQVDGNGFFTTHGNVTKQVRLFHYLKSKEYHHHHDELFTHKCDRVRELFVLTTALLLVTLMAALVL